MSRNLAAVAVLLVHTPAFAQDGTRAWEGTWVNKKYNTSGTLRCVAKEAQGGVWKATFSGVFMQERFSYEVTFDAKAGKGQTDLSGTAAIRNHKYEWTGAMKGDRLTGKYTANSGYFGDFTLKEVKAKK